MSAGEIHPVLHALVDRAEDGRVHLRSPGVGLWRGAPRKGALITPRSSLGALEVLGVLHPLDAPKGATGMVVERTRPDLARVPVAYGDLLVVLDPAAAGAEVAAEATPAARSAASGALVFRAPMSGRFYSRPSPDKAPFVEVGAEIALGTTVGLLEVMKTFNRLVYGDEGLPERARVTAVRPADGDDLAAGDPILELASL